MDEVGEVGTGEVVLDCFTHIEYRLVYGFALSD